MFLNSLFHAEHFEHIQIWGVKSPFTSTIHHTFITFIRSIAPQASATTELGV